MSDLVSNSPVAIETHDLGKSFKNVQALKSLNLKVQQHSIFGFLGPNGAGKTTCSGLARPPEYWRPPWPSLPWWA